MSADPLAMPDPYTGQPFMGPGGNLKEAGAGWRNDLIENAHVQAAMAPDVSPDHDRIPGVSPEASLAWLQALKAPIEPGTCRCGVSTTRRIAVDFFQTPSRICNSHFVYECRSCALLREAGKLRWMIENAELSEERIVEYRRDITELEAEAVPRSSGTPSHGLGSLAVEESSGVQQ